MQEAASLQSFPPMPEESVKCLHLSLCHGQRFGFLFFAITSHSQNSRLPHFAVVPKTETRYPAISTVTDFPRGNVLTQSDLYTIRLV